MKPSVAVFPTRQRLPVAYNTEIGRIITRWAFLEWRLRETTYTLLQVGHKQGRIAIREPRIVDHITMIEDLMRVQAVTTQLDLKAFRSSLRDMESFRDRLAHGVWVKHTDTNTPVLQVVKGSYQDGAVKGPIKARLYPRAVTITLQNLKDLVGGIEQATKAVTMLRREIATQLHTPLHKSRALRLPGRKRKAHQTPSSKRNQRPPEPSQA